MKEMEEKFRSIITRGFPTLEPALVSQLRDYKVPKRVNIRLWILE